MDELNEKIKRVFADLGIRCAYNMPSFWANGGKDYKVIPTKYAKGYQDALEDAEREITEVLSEQPEIIYCKDCKYAHLTYDGQCKYCDMMKDDDDRYLEKYFDGDFFCGFAERRQDADSSGNMSGTQKELKCTETHSCDCERTETHDLVSRQAALEAMDTWDKFGCDPDGKLVRYDDDKHYVPYVHYEDMVYAVKNLPSAQPRWIPVSSDSMPEDGVTVWVTIKGYDVISCEEGETLEQAIARISKIRWVTQGYWSEEEHGWNDPSFGCPLMVQPVAWMPIDTPEPYKGGQDEQT